MSQQGRSTSRMTRQSFLKATALLPLAALRSGEVTGASQGNAAPGSREPSTLFKVGNAHFQLNLAAGQGMKVELVHTPSRIALAAGDYSYSFGQPSFGEVSTADEDHATLLKLVGDIGNGLEFGHKYSVPHDKPWVEEEITLTNRSHHPIALPEGRCGFVLPVKVVGDAVESGLKDFKFTAVPYRREPTGNRTQYADYTLFQVLTEARSSRLRAQSAIQHSDRSCRGECLWDGNHTNPVPAICLRRLDPYGWPPGISGQQVQPGRNGVGVARSRSLERGAHRASLGRVRYFSRRSGTWRLACPPGVASIRSDPHHRFRRRDQRRFLRLSRRDGIPRTRLPGGLQSTRALE